MCGPSVPAGSAESDPRFDGSPAREPERVTGPRRKPDTMLWTILVVVIIVLAVIGLFTVVRGRA
jgi:hypothetical protein